MTDCCPWPNSGHAKACSEYPAPSTRGPHPTIAAGQPTDPKLSETWKKLTPSDCLPYLVAHPECETKIFRVVQCLTWLEITFAPLALE